MHSEKNEELKVIKEEFSQYMSYMYVIANKCCASLELGLCFLYFKIILFNNYTCQKYEIIILFIHGLILLIYSHPYFFV